MKPEITPCPACGRPGSERTYCGARGDERRCPHPVHDAADLAPQLAEALRDLVGALWRSYGSETAHSLRTQACLAEARALLALLPGEKEVRP
jgi:hypothetical protein